MQLTFMTLYCITFTFSISLALRSHKQSSQADTDKISWPRSLTTFLDAGLSLGLIYRWGLIPRLNWILDLVSRKYIFIACSIQFSPYYAQFLCLKPRKTIHAMSVIYCIILQLSSISTCKQNWLYGIISIFWLWIWI